ncbi:hypothetical protein HDV00_005602 [Rhizophlyctis rosea]|nr:hypothetical protein HDV00_005602 [Rhizophlyctis rosea]
MATTDSGTPLVGPTESILAAVPGSVEKPTTTPEQVKNETDALPATTTATAPPKEDATVPAVTVPSNVVDKIAEVVEKGKPDPSRLTISTDPVAKPSFAAAVDAAKVLGDAPPAVAAAATTLAAKGKLEKQQSAFRSAGKAVVAAQTLASSVGPTPRQALSRLTGVVLEDDGDIPAPLRSFLVSSVKTLDSVQAQIDTYRPMIEMLVYWENLKVALYFSTAIFMTWFLTYFRFGFGWVVIILMMVGGAYRRNLRRLRRKINNEFVTLAALKKMDSDSESVEWLNLFLSRFWIDFEPGLTAGIQAAVNSVLETQKPAFLEELALTTFTLGSQAPRVESVRAYPSTSDDTLTMDWDISFVPIDEDRLSKEQMRRSDIRQSKVELTARVGKGVASIPLPVLVTDMELRGLARVHIKFMTTFPNIKSVDVGFLQPPLIDFTIRPLKGMDLMDTPGLNSFLKDTIDWNVKTMLVDPNKLTIDLEQLMGISPTGDKVVGVLKVRLCEGKQLKNAEMTGKSDPYAKVLLGGKEVYRTKPKSATLNAFWDETTYIIITKTIFDTAAADGDLVTFQVMDHNVSKDKSMGVTAPLKLSRWIKLLEDDTAEEPLSKEEHSQLLDQWGSPYNLEDAADVWQKLLVEGTTKPRGGDVRLHLAYFPIKDVIPGAPVVESPAGVLQIVVHQAKELATSKNANPECVMYAAGGNEVFRTPVKRRTNNPVWDAPFTMFTTDLASAKFKFVVTSGGGPIADVWVSPQDVIGKEDADWFKLRGDKGKLRLTFKFIPIDLDSANLDGRKIKRKEPVGMIRLEVKEAKGLVNVEMLGKSDPYVKVGLAGRHFGATHVKENTLDPKWNEVFYAVVYSRRERLSLDLWDWNNLAKDRTLGKVDFNLSDLVDLEQDEEGEEDGVADAFKTNEKLARFRQDGLKILKNESALQADVWSPIYIFKGDAEDINSVGTKSVDDTTSLASPTGSSDMIFFGRKEPKQKGHLHFEVAFFPVVNGKVVHAQKAKPKSVLIEKVEVEPVEGETEEELQERIEKKRKEVEAKNAEVKAKEEAEAAEEEEKETPAQLVGQYPSGILRLRVHEIKEVNLTRKKDAYVELCLNDEAFFSTRKKPLAETTSFDESIDKFVPNLASQKVSAVFKVQKEKDSKPSEDEVLGFWTGDIISLIGKYGEVLTLRAGSPKAPGQGLAGKVKLSVGYAPVTLDSEEAAGEGTNSQGILHVDILEAINVEGVDQRGTSDPYCQILLNGNKVYKTKTIKKTVNPVWNEAFTSPVQNRFRSTLQIQVRDWNQLSKHTVIGTVTVQLSRLAPDQVVEGEFPLEGAAKGVLKLRLFFDPQTVDVSKKSMDAGSRLDGDENAVKKFGTGLGKTVAGTAVGLVSGIGGVGKGVAEIVIKGDDKQGGASQIDKIVAAKGLQPKPQTPILETTLATPAEVAESGDYVGDAISLKSDGSSTLGHTRTTSRTGALLGSNLANDLTGEVTFTIVAAKDLKAVDNGGTSDPYIKVVQEWRGKSKTLHKTAVIKKSLNPVWTRETFTIKVPPQQLRFVIKDHNTFGDNVDLGEVLIDVGEVFAGGKEVKLDRWFPLGMGGTGEVHLVGEFRAGVGGGELSRSSSATSLADKRGSVGSLEIGERSREESVSPTDGGSGRKSGLFGKFTVKKN